MISTPLFTKTSRERIEQRNSLRNLEAFLRFDFSSRRKLGFVDKVVHGVSLKAFQTFHLNVFTRYNPVFWWKDPCNLSAVCTYVMKELPSWKASLDNEGKKRVDLERQCARLARKVASYNEKLKSLNPEAGQLVFVDGLEKKCRVIVNYPKKLTEGELVSQVTTVAFDRLTTEAELRQKIDAVLQKPLAIAVKDNECEYSVAPRVIFKQELQSPERHFNPSDNQLRPDIYEVNVSFMNPDWPSIAMFFRQQGLNEAMPRVYQQGVADGRAQGYAEAVMKFRKALLGI